MYIGIGFRCIIFIFFALPIAAVDFRLYRIPDILLLLLLFSLVAIDIFNGQKQFFVQLITGIGAFGLFYAVRRLCGGLGFGDVKYAGVLGYFLGPDRVFQGLLCAVLLGLVVWVLGRIFFHWNRTTRFPLGPCLSLGAIAAMVIPGAAELIG